MAEEYKGLPVPGYKPQSAENISRVTMMKELEERVLLELDPLKETDSVDQRRLAIGRTQLEQAFMAINRSVFRPGRING